MNPIDPRKLGMEGAEQNTDPALLEYLRAVGLY